MLRSVEKHLKKALALLQVLTLQLDNNFHYLLISVQFQMLSHNL
jgi:hypothetical protein